MSERTNDDVPRKVHALAGRRMPFEKFFSEYLPIFCATWMDEFKARYKTKPDFEDVVTFATDCILEHEEIVHGREIDSPNVTRDPLENGE